MSSDKDEVQKYFKISEDCELAELKKTIVKVNMDNNRFRFRCWHEDRWHYFGFETYMTYKNKIDKFLDDGKHFFQCTNKKDINGDYIFEGDIIKCSKHNFSEQGELFKIYWDNVHCQFLAKSLTRGHCIDLMDTFLPVIHGDIFNTTPNYREYTYTDEQGNSMTFTMPLETVFEQNEGLTKRILELETILAQKDFELQQLKELTNKKE